MKAKIIALLSIVLLLGNAYPALARHHHCYGYSSGYYGRPGWGNGYGWGGYNYHRHRHHRHW
jgi:hypothetical protein